MEPIEQPRDLAERKTNFQSLAPEAVARAFLSVYSHRQAFIWKAVGDENWRKSTSQLRDHQIMGVISDSGRGMFRGCYFGDLTRFAVLDVDQDSKYHNPAELMELAGKLAAVGLTATPYQSSDSGGWHLYLFLDDWADSEEVSQTLRKWLKLEGYEIKGGVLEVFPSGCALRLPLQPGFAWLDSEGKVICRREEINESEAVASFLTDLESNGCSWASAKRRIDSRIEAPRGAGSAPEHKKALDLEGFGELWSDGRNQERIEEARYYLDSGLQQSGQRHDAIYAIEHLLWYGDPDRGIPKMAGTQNDRNREQFLREWLEANHNGKCRHVNRGAWRLLEGHIRRACEWRPPDYQPGFERTPYAITERSTEAMVGLTKKTGHVWTPEDLARANQKREKEARARIREAAIWIVENGASRTISEIARIAQASRDTVKKHIDLLEICLGDIDPGGRGAVSTPFEVLADSDQPGSFSSSNKKIIPLSVGVSPGAGLDDPAMVAPLSSCLAQEPTTCTQYQSQALRVPAGALTPGPLLRGIQAGTAGCAGGIFVCLPSGSFAEAERFRAGVCLSSGCLFLGRRTMAIQKRIPSRPAKAGPFSPLPEGIESLTSNSVYTRSIGRLRNSEAPHKPESGGVLVVCIQCTQLLAQDFGDSAYRRTRGPPMDVRQHK